MFEVDVDVGGITALFAQEALKQQTHFHRVDAGDAEAVADDAVGGRAASLTQDFLLAREGHNGLHCEKIRRDIQLGDGSKLLGELGFDVVRNDAIAFAGSLQSQASQAHIGALALDGFGWKGVAQLAQPKGAGGCNVDRTLQGLGMIREQAPHDDSVSDVGFAVWQQPLSGLLQAQPLANAGQHIVQALVGALSQEGSRRRQQRHLQATGMAHTPGVARSVFGGVVPEDSQRAALSEGVFDVTETSGLKGRQHQSPQAVSTAQDVVEHDLHGAFLKALPCVSENRAQVAVARVGGGVQHQGSFGQPQLAADDAAHPQLTSPGLGAHDAGQSPEVGDGKGLGCANVALPPR